MATYKLKRKIFAEEEQQSSGMSKAAKIGIGTAATVGTAALGFAGARRGMFGRKLAVKSNLAWGKLGNKLGNQGMVDSAVNKYGKVIEKEGVVKRINAKTKQGIKLNDAGIKAIEKDTAKATEKAKNKFRNTITQSNGTTATQQTTTTATQQVTKSSAPKNNTTNNKSTSSATARRSVFFSSIE